MSDQLVMTDLPARIVRRVIETDRGCWQWTGGANAYGYGSVKIDGRVLYVHRVAYEALVGPIPDGLQIDHLCRNRRCVKPKHLEAVTQRVNMLRGEGIAAIHAQTTHCPRGHEYTPENTYVHRRKYGFGRACATCKRASEKRRRDAKRVAA